MKPRFSVIMPLFNKERYVKKAIESVFTQTYRDFELIIIDDGSTDNSLDVVKEVKSQEPRAKSVCVISQQNAGVAAARNNGVAASKGEYVCFLDADDWWEANFLEEMDRLIKEYPDAGLYATNYVYYKPGNTRVWLDFKTGYLDYAHAYLIQPAMPVWTGATCMPRKIFDEMGGFPIGIKLGEDFLLWAKTALHYKVAFCEKPLAYYNNEVPASLRATRNLHKPEYHMLFNLEEIERELRAESRESRETWKALLDKLRVSGLMEYWMDDTYHDVAEDELMKVEWNKQPKKAKAQYEKPIWLLKIKCRIKQIGSFCKQKIIKIMAK